MYLDKLASQIKNDILSGLRGYHNNLGISIEQLKDECVNVRLLIIREQQLQGTLQIKDLLTAINCIEVDCESLERCKCNESVYDTIVAHFQIPQVVQDLGRQAIEYIGSSDRKNQFQIITSLGELETRQYRKRGKNKPYVWIDFAPNSEGMLDCFIFNAPMIQQVSVVGVFKDPRQLERYECCIPTQEDELRIEADDNMNYITHLVKERLTAEKIKYYRQLAMPYKPNDQTYNP